MPAPSHRVADGVLVPIQFLRAIAAMMVVWHHSMEQLPGLKGFLPPSFGALGVDLFFVLSGFIMGVTTSGRTMTPTQFILRRIVRIVPLYWALTLAVALLALIAPALFRSTSVTWPHMLLSLAFVPHWSPGHPGHAWPILVPGWSLNYEMFFYAVFALALLLPARLRLPSMAVVFVGLVTLGAMWGPFDNAIAASFTDPMILEFVAGVAISRLFVSGMLRLPLAISLCMIAFGASAVVFAGIGTIPPMPNILLGSSLLVAGVLHPRILELRQPVLLALGDASYSIYLTHLLALGVERALWVRIVPGDLSLLSSTMFVLLGMLASAVLGWLAYYTIEKPVTRRLTARLPAPADRRGGLAPTPAAIVPAPD